MQWFQWNYVLIPLLVFLISLIGGMFTNEGLGNWYKTISKPDWTPGGSIIGTVWTVLYILIAVSAILVWNQASRGLLFWTVIALFLVNAVLNVGWNYVFFARHSLGGALAEILILEATIVGLVALTEPLSRLASTLLLPYAAWVAFASYLTYSVWQLNKTLATQL